MFIDKYYSYIKNKNLNKVVIAPINMTIDNTEDEEGWVEWKLVKSNINTKDIENLESKFNFKYPKEYLKFVQYKQFMDIQIDQYVIFGVNELNTLEKIILRFPDKIMQLDFIPIGYINDTDFLALNVKNGEVVSLGSEDYKLHEVLFGNFDEFEEFLSEKI